MRVRCSALTARSQPAGNDLTSPDRALNGVEKTSPWEGGETTAPHLQLYRKTWYRKFKAIAARMRLGASKGASRNLHSPMRRRSPPATGQAPLPTKGNPGSTK
jgi:hypothetical protein